MFPDRFRSRMKAEAWVGSPLSSMLGMTGFAIALTLSLGCISVPRAAPELSAQLGQRIEAIQKSHLALLDSFFGEKRKQVDRFLYEEWLPVYAEEVFGDPRVQSVWRQVIASDAKDADRLKFLMVYGPRIQSVLDQKRRELHEPLDELEQTLSKRLRDEYDQARSMNVQITSLLESAAKLSERQDNVRDRMGLSSEELSSYLNEADGVVGKLLEARSKGEKLTSDFRSYSGKLSELIAKAKK